ncbi:MAG: LamG domain-containing protein [Planctomycetota bacterium]
MRKSLRSLGIFLLAVALFHAVSEPAAADVVAYWNFEDGVAGQAFTPSGVANGEGGSLDQIDSVLMRGFNASRGPSFTSATSPGGGSLGMHVDGGQDGYVEDLTLPALEQWTIETHVSLGGINGWRTLIGRDGSSNGSQESDFYLQNNGIDNSFRINYLSAGGTRHVLDGTFAVQLNTWYGLAVTSDGSTLNMFLDDGSGYTNIGSLDISANSAADNALPSTSFLWSFGRGWFNNSLTDYVTGTMDNIRFSDMPLTPAELIAVAVPEPSPIHLYALPLLVMAIRRRSAGMML